MGEPSIESVSRERRVFPPSQAFRDHAWVGSRADYDGLYRRSLREPEAFWADQARALRWFTPPTRTLEWEPPHARWFVGGTLNASVNCLDRHLDGPRANKAAIVWEGEPGEVRTLTYRELAREVCRLANALQALGVQPGDRVAIYMGMVPETIVAMLACARIGAVHSVIFGGFAADAAADRILDAGAKVVLTQDGAYRRGQVVPLKDAVDEALVRCPEVKSVIVLRRAGNAIAMTPGRDHEWSEIVAKASPTHTARGFDSEHPLFILHTSGSTGKPKGILHATAGYLLSAQLTTQYVFDLRDNDVYWCTADVGWITGHTYGVYGPLSLAATVVMYEGAPNHPDAGRWWSIVERHAVSVLYTAPTAIRACIQAGDAWVKAHDISTLRLLGTVGEPLNPEAWMWYREVVGGGRCPIVDTYWQTETGCIVLTPLPGATDQKPGSCSVPFFGISAKVLREDGTEAGVDEGGLLVIDRPWPGMLRAVWGNEERFRSAYFARFPGLYLTGDVARRDADGDFWIIGRSDDVIKVSGHRLGSAEIESALVSHPAVAEAAVVGVPHEITGEAIVAFVTLKRDHAPVAQLPTGLVAHVADEVGKFAQPKEVRIVEALPKTRSGKIMRRLLRDIAAGRAARGDVTTLDDADVLTQLSSAAD